MTPLAVKYEVDRTHDPTTDGTIRGTVTISERPEADVVINGTTLTVGQAATLRVAVESFASTLTDEGLGDDEHGRRMVDLYLARVEEIRAAMYR